MKANYGSVKYDGKRYVQVQNAYLDGAKEDAHYIAAAICPDDQADADGYQDLYEIRWEILPDLLDDLINGEIDEADACDWASPEAVRNLGPIWNQATGQIE